MKPIHLTIASIAFLIIAATALAAVRGLGIGDDPLAFVVGAIVGTQVGTFLHARSQDTTASLRAKLALGSALAVIAVIFGLVVHTAVGIKYPEVTLPISAIGTFVFPFILFNQMFNATRGSTKHDS